MKGVIWYQGEGNKNHPKEYGQLFPEMISSWREAWGIGQFPFYFVQIAPFGYSGTNAAFLREAQLNTMNSVDNTGMAVTMDIGECSNIHPGEKQKVGERLAYWAFAKDYDIDGISYSGPVYDAMEMQAEGRVKLTFDYAPRGLSTFGSDLSGFEIAGKDSVFHKAKAKINWREPTVSVWSPQGSDPVAVRYGFNALPNLNRAKYREADIIANACIRRWIIGHRYKWNNI